MNERKEYFKKPKTCVFCGSDRIASILYGLPVFDPKLEADMKEGKIVLGGCCISMDDPMWECSLCHTRFFKKRDKDKQSL